MPDRDPYDWAEDESEIWDFGTETLVSCAGEFYAIVNVSFTPSEQDAIYAWTDAMLDLHGLD